MNKEEINKLIAPFQIHYDQKQKRNYFFNLKTGDSVWKLPEALHEELESYFQRHKPEEQKEGRNLYKYIPKDYFKKQREAFTELNEKYKLREARKQVETSLANTFAYKQGDQEYNIWYNKYINQKPKEIREASLTRCQPQKDIGFTRADLFDASSAYFCLYFAKGCCALGVKCGYLHRLPSLEECESIDNSRDIFGRKRFSTVKNNQAGVGCFNNDTRVLYIQDFKNKRDESSLSALYESMFRHFSMWALLEDITIVPQKSIAFVKYAHRCMAEFAKEAMDKQALDLDDILTIKWANDEPRRSAQEEKHERSVVARAVVKRAEEQSKEQRRKAVKESRAKFVTNLIK